MREETLWFSLAALGGIWVVISLVILMNSFVINDVLWECTAPTIIKGKAECTRYERREVKP